MDKIEQFIKENREQFDVHEPAPEVWERIAAGRGKQKIVRLNWTSILWKAAAIVVILSASWITIDYFAGKQNRVALVPDNTSREIIIPELQEAEMYYAGQINEKLDQVYKYTDGFPDIKKDINKDMSELDSVYAELKKDLKDGVSSEEVVAAMIRNYRMKLRVLEDILTILQRTNESEKNKKKSYEL